MERLEPLGRCGPWPLVLALAAAIPACVVDVEVGDAVDLRCGADADCPPPMTCQLDAGRCAAPGQVFDTAPPQVTGAASSTPVIAATGAADLTITTTEALAAAVVRVEGDAEPLPTVIEGSEVRCTVEAAGRAAGAILLLVTVTDLAGNVAAEARLSPGLSVDPDAPGLRSDEVVVRPGTDNVLFPGVADAARADSTVQVELGWDEPPVAVTALQATDATGAVIALDDVDIRADAALSSSFTLGAAALALLDDGEWTLSVLVEDGVGNAARRALSSTLVVDTTAPAAPTLDLLERAPFGDDRPVPRARVSGTATDALLVLAIPAGVEVDPARVPPALARLPVEAGVFSGDIGVDVPGLRVVAVDAAGNLSAPGAARRVALVASAVLPSSPHALLERPVVSEHLRQRGDVRVDDAFRADGHVTSRSAVFWRPLTTVRHDPLPRPGIAAADPVAGGVLVVADGFTFRVHHGQVERLAVDRLPIRRGAAMATDARRGRVVLFGGKDVDGRVRNDLFEWNGERWTAVLAHSAGATDRPSPREGHGMTGVPALGGVVVVGGCGSDDPPPDEPPFFGCEDTIPLEVWRWDGAAFSPLCRGDACGAGPRPLRPELTIDDNGALLASGGVDNTFSGFTFVGDPRVFRFADNRFTAGCDGDCSAAFPGDSVAVFDTTRGLPAFIGTCGSGPCVAHLDGETLEVTALPVAVPLEADALQQRAVAVDGDLTIVMGGSNPGTVAGVRGADAGVLAPRALQRRCGGAAAVVDGVVEVLGGCQACRSDTPLGLCSQPIGTAQAPARLDPTRADTPISGNALAVPLDDDTLIATVGFPDASTGTTGLRRRGDLDTALPPLEVGSLDVGIGGVPRHTVGGYSVDGTSALFVQGFVDTISLADVLIAALDPPVIEISPDGTQTARCTTGCFTGIVGLGDGRGTMIARGGGGGGLLFGGANTRGAAAAATVTLDASGQGTSVTGGPIGRAWGNLVYDPERDVTWLVNGAAGDAFSFPPASCNVAGVPLCTDLWRFDEGGWQEVTPVDITGFGGPPGRAHAQAASGGGGLVMAGGAAASTFPSEAFSDAWALAASSATAMSHQLRATHASYGADADGDFDGLRARWCGSATDATGAAVDVDVRVWVGGRWIAASTVVEGDCRVAALAPDGVADLILDDARGLVVEVTPRLTSTGTRDPALSTTGFTLTTFFSPR